MELTRRQCLTGAAAVAVSGTGGCLDSVQNTASTDGGGPASGPEYDVTAETLLPDEFADDWSTRDYEAAHDRNPDLARVWVASEDSITVAMDATVFEAEQAAIEAMQSARATAASPREYPLADAGIVTDNGTVARCLFRDSNAVGETLAFRTTLGSTTPDRPRATLFAEYLHGYW